MTEQEAIAVFEEILAIDYRDTIPKYYKAMELAVKYMKEIQQYRSIGTPEECRTAVDKQRKKKILNPLTSFSLGTCPVCSIHQLGRWRYCSRCGQKLDWSDEE